MVKHDKVTSDSKLGCWASWWGNVGQVALEGGFERHALRGTALDIDATHHFIFGATAPSPERHVWYEGSWR